MLFQEPIARFEASRVAYFVAPSLGFSQIRYFMTCVYWVIHEP